MNGFQVQNGIQGANSGVITEELLKRAESEIGEKETWRDRDVQALRDILNSKCVSKYLPCE